jgi:hypothetical protein
LFPQSSCCGEKGAERKQSWKGRRGNKRANSEEGRTEIKEGEKELREMKK